jgi:hypothetical protein
MKLTLYPLVGLFFLNADRIAVLTWRRPLFRFLAVMGGLWCTWMFCSLFLAVDADAITGNNLKGAVNDITRFVPWYVFVAGCFLVPREDLKRTLYWAFVTLFGLCSLYSGLEFLHFAGVEWATETLKAAIGCFMHTGFSDWVNGSVWPPILWDSERYRSLFEEPAYFSVFIGFCALLFMAIAWQAKTKKCMVIHLLMAVLSVVLLSKTKSAAGAVAFSAASFVWIVLALCFRKRGDCCARCRMVGIAIFLIIASVLAMVTQRHSAKSMAELAQAKKTSTEHASSTRAIHLAAELDCIKASPVYGVGPGEYSNVMRETLDRAPEKTEEIEVWASPEHNPPMLNLFTGIAVSYGWVGLLLFLGWFMVPTLGLWIKQYKTLSMEQGCVTAALGSFIVCIMMSANTEIFCYMLLVTIPLIIITEDRTKALE